VPSDNYFRSCYQSPDVNEREKSEERPGDSQCGVLRFHSFSRLPRWGGATLFLYNNRGLFIGSIKKMFRHFGGHANAPVRGTIAWNVAGMHPVSASEAQKVRHFCSLKFRALGLVILGYINVSFHDLAILVDVVTVEIRNVMFVLLDDAIFSRRRFKAFATGGNSRFAHNVPPFIKVSSLLVQVNNNLWSAGRVVPVPICWHRPRSGLRRFHRISVGLFLRLLEINATGTNQKGGRGDCQE